MLLWRTKPDRGDGVDTLTNSTNNGQHPNSNKQQSHISKLESHSHKHESTNMKAHSSKRSLKPTRPYPQTLAFRRLLNVSFVFA